MRKIEEKENTKIWSDPIPVMESGLGPCDSIRVARGNFLPLLVRSTSHWLENSESLVKIGLSPSLEKVKDFFSSNCL